MDTRNVFLETKKLRNEAKELYLRLNDINDSFQSIKDNCPHEIVFKYRDNHPMKMVVDGNYYCPACGKLIYCHYQELYTTDFKDSRVIPLSLSLLGTRELLSAIRREVIDNMDDYYNQDISTEELIMRMETLLQEYQYHYQEPIKVLEKSTRRNDD